MHAVFNVVVIGVRLEEAADDLKPAFSLHVLSCRYVAQEMRLYTHH